VSFTIYGFRLRGDTECRYVGLTSREPQRRLAYLTGEAHQRNEKWQLRDPDAFQRWLLDHEPEIETFQIHSVATKPEAHIAERAIVAAMLATDHRLFNHWLVPAALRIAA
jgi:hypothetical protein